MTRPRTTQRFKLQTRPITSPDRHRVTCRRCRRGCGQAAAPARLGRTVDAVLLRRSLGHADQQVAARVHGVPLATPGGMARTRTGRGTAQPRAAAARQPYDIPLHFSLRALCLNRALTSSNLALNRSIYTEIKSFSPCSKLPCMCMFESDYFQILIVNFKISQKQSCSLDNPLQLLLQAHLLI